MINESNGIPLFDDPNAALNERIEAMAAANRSAGAKYTPDPVLDSIQARNKENSAGFTVGQAEKAVSQMDVRDIVTDGAKRAIELSKQRHEPKTGRERTDEVAKLSASGKRRRDDRRDLRPEVADPVIFNEPGAMGLADEAAPDTGEYTPAEIDAAFKKFREHTQPRRELGDVDPDSLLG